MMHDSGHLAYIETAIYGTNFCHSLYKAVKALVKNVVRFSFVTLFSKLVLILGKLLVVAAALGLVTSVLGFYLHRRCCARAPPTAGDSIELTEDEARPRRRRRRERKYAQLQKT